MKFEFQFFSAGIKLPEKHVNYWTANYRNTVQYSVLFFCLLLSFPSIKSRRGDRKNWFSVLKAFAKKLVFKVLIIFISLAKCTRYERQNEICVCALLT